MLTYNAVVMAVVNIILDYGLIFGNLGMPEMGVRGAALASVLSELTSLFFYVFYTRSRIDAQAYGLVGILLRRIDTKQMRDTYNLSKYLMVQALVSTLSWSLFFFMIEKLGEHSLAIATISRSIYSLLYIPVMAYGTAANTTVSRLIGAGRSEEISSYLRMVWRTSLLTAFVLIGTIGLYPQRIIGLFTDSAPLIADTVPSYYVIGSALLVASVASLYFTSVSATGATRKTLQIELYTIVGYLLYSAVMVFVFRAPVHVCFSVEVLYYAAILMMSRAFIVSGAWRSEKWRTQW